MSYFEKMLEREQQKADEKAMRLQGAKIKQQVDLKELHNKLNEEEISAFKSGDNVVITLPVGYLVIYGVVSSPKDTLFTLQDYCEYELPRIDTSNSVKGAMQKIKFVIEKLANYVVDERLAEGIVDWTRYNQLKEKAER